MKIVIDIKSRETKVQQLINELLRVINTDFNKGDLLPSVNQLSKQLGISRDTVFKAYSELKKQNVVNSTPTKGYFVSHKVNKILMVLDFYSPFKDIVYREFEKTIGNEYTVDLVFHHYNNKVFNSVITENLSRYNYFIVMNIDTTDFIFSDSLKKIDPSKLLLLDIPIEDWNGLNPDNYNYVWQDFNRSVYKALIGLYDQVKKYRTFKLIYPKHLQHPASILRAYYKVCDEMGKPPIIIENRENIKIDKGDAFFILRETDLYEILCTCKNIGLDIGNEVGILAYNDIPLYEFVSCGITVISANFKLMGNKAAEFVKNGNKTKEVIATDVILRDSL